MARQHVDHYIPLFGRDFYTATAMWTAEEVGHYIRLLVIQWDSGGLPADVHRLELVSPGVSKVWELLSQKFPVCDDGLRRNARMEEHRARARELKEARSEAGQTGNKKRWSGRKPVANGSQTDRKPIATASQNDRKPIANGVAKTSPPSPSPSPSPSSTETAKTNTHTPCDFVSCVTDELGSGWAAEEWERFADQWNSTARASPWKPLGPPSSWVDYAASPGWLDRARQAVEHLPACRWFESPLAVTRFFEYVDRILAGEFDNAKPQHRAGGDKVRENCL